MNPNTQQMMNAAFQSAAGFSGHDFELFMRCLIAIFLAGWVIILLGCFLKRASQEGVEHFYWRLLALAFIATLMGVYIGGG